MSTACKTGITTVHYMGHTNQNLLKGGGTFSHWCWR